MHVNDVSLIVVSLISKVMRSLKGNEAYLISTIYENGITKTNKYPFLWREFQRSYWSWNNVFIIRGQEPLPNNVRICCRMKRRRYWQRPACIQRGGGGENCGYTVVQQHGWVQPWNCFGFLSVFVLKNVGNK